MHRAVGVIASAALCLLFSSVATAPAGAMKVAPRVETGSDLTLAQMPQCRAGTAAVWRCVRWRTAKNGRRYCQARKRACTPREPR